MKIINSIIVSIFFLLTLPHLTSAQTQQNLLLYYGQGCTHCATVMSYIENNNLANKLNITLKEVYNNKQSAQELTDLFVKYNVPTMQQGVPFAVINDQYFVGDKDIIKILENETYPLLATDNSEVSNPEPTTNSDTVTNSDNTNPIATTKKANATLNIWVVTAASLVDAINPCAFAVLVILMGTILLSGNRKKTLFSGLTFSLAIYLSYLAMGLGLYSAISSVGISIWLTRGIGILAILLGLFNIKDAIWYGKGFLMEVPLSWRPKLKQLIQSVSNPIVAFFIGILISLFLLPCTSGPYIVIIGMLGASATFSTALQWLIYYNFIFILPMIIITLMVYYGLKPEKLEEIRQRRLRLLHAIAGIILLALGIYLLV